MAILNLVVLTCTSPFGWIGGQMSEVNRSLPFMLTISLYVAGAALAFFASRRRTVHTQPTG